MSGASRREVARIAAGALLLPFLSALPVRARADAGGRFAPPHSPMLYNRRLERGLPGGQSLAVTRSFEVRFVHHGAGYRLEGTQVGVDVAAPERLAALAEMERRRVESGVFPMMLDRGGRIIGLDGVPAADQLDLAIGEVMDELAETPLAPGDREAVNRFVAAVNQSVSQVVTLLPVDLFAPLPEARSETRRIELPGGTIGEVTMAFAAESDPDTGLMRQATREVVTRLAGEERRTLESWTLAPVTG